MGCPLSDGVDEFVDRGEAAVFQRSSSENREPALDEVQERRLDLLEELYDRESRRLLDLVGRERGGRFLEVGAGRGSLVSFMLARCGARGQVVVTDITPGSSTR